MCTYTDDRCANLTQWIGGLYERMLFLYVYTYTALGENELKSLVRSSYTEKHGVTGTPDWDDEGEASFASPHSAMHISVVQLKTDKDHHGYAHLFKCH